METDGSGKGTYELKIPTVLTGGNRIDAYGIRVIQGGVVTSQKITITEGFRVELGAKKVLEQVSSFPMGIRNATPNATVTMKWYLDDVFRTTQTFRTDNNGDGTFTVRTPSMLIRNAAGEDTFRVVVNVDGQSVSFTFKMLVFKYTSTQQSSPNPGGSQSQSAAPAPTTTNSAPGVTHNTPAALGTKNVRPINKAESPTLASPDPIVTVQDRMKHQLVILCYGFTQYQGKNEASTDRFEKPGMDEVYKSLTGYVPKDHILTLWSGNSIATSLEAFSDAKALVDSKLKALNIKSIVIAGYSWGGGMAKELVNYIGNFYPTIEISGLAYIDAVKHTVAGRETALPSTPISSFLNVYESVHMKVFDVFGDIPVHGDGHIANPQLTDFTGTTYYRRYHEIDVDRIIVLGVVIKWDVMSHTEIDNLKSGLVASFIGSVLYGWYSDHPNS